MYLKPQILTGISAGLQSSDGSTQTNIKYSACLQFAFKWEAGDVDVLPNVRSIICLLEWMFLFSSDKYQLLVSAPGLIMVILVFILEVFLD